MYLNYTNLLLSRKADESDKEVMRKETSKPQKGF
jgi:hypothetical protein